MSNEKSKYGTRYSDAVRDRAIAMCAMGKSTAEVSAALGIGASTVKYWRRLYGIASPPGTANARPAKVKREGSGVVAPAPYRRGYVYGAGY